MFQEDIKSQLNARNNHKTKEDTVWIIKVFEQETMLYHVIMSFNGTNKVENTEHLDGK